MHRALAAAIGFTLLAIPASASAQTPEPSVVASPLASPAHPAAAGTLAPGTIINAQNADQYGNFLPEAARLALGHGFKIEATPTRRLQWSAGFEHATEKYSPQVGLDKDDFIANYVAGMPFPLIDLNDPKAAVKIAYNWHMGPVLPDDYSLSPWSSNGYAADRTDPTKILPSNDFDDQCDQFQFLRFAHRTDVDPRPTLGANSTGVEWKAKCNKWSTISVGGSSGEGQGIWIRYLDPRGNDEFYAFSQESRRIRRMAITLEYPDKTCRQCHQPYWAYALPKTELYTYRVLGTAALLACMSASDEPAGIAPSESSYRLTQEPFELRRAYILEMTPRKKDLAERTLIYIDSEIYVWIAAEFFEGGERVASAIPLWRTQASPEGGNLYHLAGSFYFPTDRRGFFRSVVPAHASSFIQKINSGAISDREFSPQVMMMR
jgi:uncharacterized protein DUF1329